jgi:isopentenyl-diphosphate delta-isomerase
LVTEEVIDVVNCSDEVIGTASRATVHQNNLRHRAAHILVFNNSGELYVQRRSLDKDTSPGLWDTSAAGHVASCETYLAAAGRELHEELGLPQETKLEPLFKMDADVVTGFEFAWVYRCTATATVVPDPFEIMAGQWRDREQLSEWINCRPADFTTTFREIWTRLGNARLDVGQSHSAR